MKLFNKADVLTAITCNRAKIGDKGYFGNSFFAIEKAIKEHRISEISQINQDMVVCFMDSSDGFGYGLFLPENKNAKIFRALKNVDELFDFMLPDCAGADYTTDEKVEKLLGQRYTIKDKIDGTLKQHIVSFLNTSADGTLLLDFVDLGFLFENYEFKKGDIFVPFGIEE
jgi:hypothetical protein